MKGIKGKHRSNVNHKSHCDDSGGDTWFGNLGHLGGEDSLVYSNPDDGFSAPSDLEED